MKKIDKFNKFSTNEGIMKPQRIVVQNVNKTIQHSLDFSIRHYGNNMQIETIYPEYNRDFLEYCISKSHKYWLEELSGYQREKTDKSLDFILDKVDGTLACGIKIYHRPLMKLYEWERWDGGYIELFVRTNKRGEPDYFIWGIIEMDHFRDILETFKGKLEYKYF